jgi:hypothetical protein
VWRGPDRSYGRGTSSPDPTPPRGASWLARLGWAAKDKLFGRGDEPRDSDAVKLVHSDDLHRWERFPRYQEFGGITFGQYRAEAYQLERRRRRVADLVNAMGELTELDRDEVVEYQSATLEVPRRAPWRRTASLPLPESPRPGARVESSAGGVREGFLELEAGWRRQFVRLSYRGPSELVHAERIEELRRLLDSMSEEQRSTVEEVTASRYAQPVLFISHRWEDAEHPDPEGSQLRHLRTLKGCFLVYDYSSFPQPPRTDEEEAELRKILAAMGELISNVVVLAGPDYLTRGWCLYEYIVAALRRTTVCDELKDDRFVRLRDWASTSPPASWSFRDSFESQQQNDISQRILAVVNEVLPLYEGSRFTNEADRPIVTELLVDHLQRTLPPIKESQQYLGEWATKGWTKETLRPFFLGEAELPRLEAAIPIRSFDTAVPSTLREAVERRYEIRRPDWRSALNPLDSLARYG